ncbi:MAG: type II secretion system secretin GspD [Oligoflexia bacterium]|nr:type II secretion system secretin GspD [Oligoflexia bacterium]
MLKRVILISGILIAGANPASGQEQPDRGLGRGAKQAQSRGADEVVVTPDPQADLPRVVESFDFNNVDVLTLVKQISKLTGKKFILNSEVLRKKGITIIAPTQISVQEAYNVFLTVLDSNDLAVVKAGKFLKIIQKKDVSGGVSLYKGDYYPRNDEYITRVIKLKYIDAENLEDILAKGRGGALLTKKDIKMKAFGDTNTLIVTATGSQIAELEEIIALLDVKGFDNQLAVIPVNYADAAKIKDMLENLLFDKDGGKSKKRGSSGVSSGAERYSKIFTDERTNAIIALANEPGVRKIRELVRKLDFVIEGGNNMHVYYMKNARAKDISQTLSNIIGSGKAAKGAEFTNVSITADDGINALVISAKPKEYEAIQEVINMLDVRKGQVLFETITMEISLDDDSSFGISSNYALSPEVPRAVGFDPGVSSQNNIMNFLTNPGALSGLILGFGSNKTVTANIGGTELTIPSLAAFITALEKNSEANILQRPSIITSDNEEAKITVLDKIPVLKGSTITQGLAQQSVDKEEVGLQLTITPHINETSDFIKLDLEQETSNITDKAPRDLAGTTVATSSRKIKTSVVVRDEDTVVIGGLYRDDVSTTYNKVPILGDIPIIGWLFKGKTSRSVKTNLLVFITPHIVRDYEKHSKLTRDALRSRKGFIKQNFGGEDKFKDIVEAIERKNQYNLTEKTGNKPGKKTGEEQEKEYLPESGVKPLTVETQK